MTTAAPNLAPPRSWRWHYPLRLRGGLNAREHFRVRAKRVARERTQTKLSAVVFLGSGWWKLDDDNLPGSCKGVRDEIASILGITDGPEDPRARWITKQRKGAYGVEVEIRSVQGGP